MSNNQREPAVGGASSGMTAQLYHRLYPADTLATRVTNATIGKFVVYFHRLAMGDWLTIAIAVVTLTVISIFKKLPELYVIIARGVIGLLTYRAIQPQ